MRRKVLAFPILALALVAVVDALQNVEIRGASIALVPRTVAVQLITLENRRQSPLMAWEIRTTGNPAHGSIVSNSDFTRQTVSPGPDSGPIPPGKPRMLEVQLSPGTSSPPTSTLELAVFADGVIDGTVAGIARWQHERREYAEDVGYWRDAFAKMPRTSDQLAKEYLAARVAERSAVANSDHSGVRGHLARLWHQTPQAPGFVLAMVESIEKDMARQAAMLTRAQPPPSLQSAAPVSLTSRLLTKTHYVVALRNLRDSPIEAVAFDYFEPGSERPSGGQSMDFCTTDPAARDGFGRINPGETRESRFSRDIAHSAAVPKIMLRFVLFDDLSFEGRSADRDELLRRREEIADDMAFANTVRAALANVPAGDLREVLQKKKTERIAHLLSLGRLPRVHALDGMIEDAARSPQRVRETAAAVVAREEEQRRRLLRHVR